MRHNLCSDRAMTHKEYETRRVAIDQQLAAGIELLQAGHRAQLRVLELVWMLNPDDELSSRTPTEPAPATASAQPVPLDEKSPAAPPRRRRGAWELYDEVEAALARVGDELDRNDVVRALGYEPQRASLHRVFLEMEKAGLLKRLSQGSGRRPGRFQRLARETAKTAAPS